MLLNQPSVYDSPESFRDLVQGELLKQQEDKNVFEHVRGASEQLFLGVVKGFSTFHVGSRPDSTFEELAYSVGNLIGFLGGIGSFGKFTNLASRGVSLTNSMVRGTFSGMKAYAGHRNIQLAREAGKSNFFRAKAQYDHGVNKFRQNIKNKTPDWFAEPTLQFNSVPFYVAELLKRGAKAGLAKVPTRASGAKNTANWLYDVNKVLPVGSKQRDTLEQAFRIGTAFGVSEWQNGPKAMAESFAMGAVFGGFDKVIANYTPLKPKIGHRQKITDLKNLRSKNAELRIEAQKQMARGFAGGLFNMGSSIVLGGKPELYWYDFALGFYFGGVEISASQRRALGIIQKAEIDNSWRYYEKLPEWNGEGTDEYGNPTPKFDDEVKFELLRHKDQKETQMNNMFIFNETSKVSDMTREDYDYYSHLDYLHPVLKQAFLDAGVINQADINEFNESGLAFGPEIISNWFKIKDDPTLGITDINVSGMSEPDVARLDDLLKKEDPDTRIHRDEDGNAAVIRTAVNTDGAALEQVQQFADTFKRLNLYDLTRPETHSTENAEQDLEKTASDWIDSQPEPELKDGDQLAREERDRTSLTKDYNDEVKVRTEKIDKLDEEFENNDIPTKFFKDLFSDVLLGKDDGESNLDLLDRAGNAYRSLYNHVRDALITYKDKKLNIYRDFDEGNLLDDDGNLKNRDIPKERRHQKKEAFDRFLKDIESDLGAKLTEPQRQNLKYKFNEAVFAVPVDEMLFDIASDGLKEANKYNIQKARENAYFENGILDVDTVRPPRTHEYLEDPDAGTIVFASDMNIKNYSGQRTFENALSDIIHHVRQDVRGDREQGRFGAAGYALFGGDLVFANPESVKFNEKGDVIVNESMQYEKRNLAEAFEDVQNIEPFLENRARRMYQEGYLILYGIGDKDYAVVVENPFKNIDQARTYLSQQFALVDDILANMDPEGFTEQDRKFFAALKLNDLPEYRAATIAFQLKYRLHAEGFTNLRDYIQAVYDPKNNFIKTSVNLNKRRQIETQRTESLETFEDLSVLSEQGQKERALRVLLVNDGETDPVTGKYEEVMTDGAALIRKDLMRGLVNHGGMDVGDNDVLLPSSVKPFIHQLGTNNDGQFMGKMAFHQGSSAHEAFMKKHGIDVIMYRSAAKATGTRTFYNMNEQTNRIDLTDDDGKRVDNPDIYSINLSSVTLNRGKYDNAAKNIKKDTRLPVQIYQSLRAIDNEAAEALRDLAFNRDGSEWNGYQEENAKVKLIYDRYMTNPESGVAMDEFFNSSEEYRIDVNKIGMKEMLSVIYHMNGPPTHLYSRVMNRILRENEQDKLERHDLTEEEQLLEDIQEPFNEILATLDAQKGADMHFRIASKTRITPADRLSKHGFNYFDRVLQSYVALRLFRPRVQGGIKSTMLPNTGTLGKVRADAFKLAEGARLKPFEWRDGKMTTLGKAWDEFQRRGGWKSAPDWMKERMRMMTMRSPAPTISATRVLEFDGFLDGITGTGVQFHNIDMKYQGGADLDIDDAFVFMNMPVEFKDVVNRPENKFTWHEGFDIKNPFSSEKSRDEDFIDSNSETQYGTYEETFDPTAQWKFNVNAKTGKDLMAKVLGMGKMIVKFFHSMQNIKAPYGENTEKTLTLLEQESPELFDRNNLRDLNTDEQWYPKPSDEVIEEHGDPFLKRWVPPSIGDPNRNSGSSMGDNTTLDTIDFFNGPLKKMTDEDPNAAETYEYFNQKEKLQELSKKYLGWIDDAQDIGRVFWTAEVRKGAEHEVDDLIRQASNYAADSANYPKLKSFENFRRLLFETMFDLGSLKIYAKKKGEKAVEMTDIFDYVDWEYVSEFVMSSNWEYTSPTMRAIQDGIGLLNRPHTFYHLERSQKNLWFIDGRGVDVGYWKKTRDDLPLHFSVAHLHERLNAVRPQQNLVSTPYEDVTSLFYKVLEDMTLLDNTRFVDQRLTKKIYVFQDTVTEEMAADGGMQFSESAQELHQANRAFDAIKPGLEKDRDLKVFAGVPIKERHIWGAFHPKNWYQRAKMFDLGFGTKRDKRQKVKIQGLDVTTERQETVLDNAGRERINVGTDIKNPVVSDLPQKEHDRIVKRRAYHKSPDILSELRHSRQGQINRKWGDRNPIYAEALQERQGAELNAQDLADETSLYYMQTYAAKIRAEADNNKAFFEAFQKASNLNVPGQQVFKKFFLELAGEAAAMRDLAKKLHTPTNDFASVFDLIESTSIELGTSATKVQSVLAKAFADHLRDKTERVYNSTPETINQDVTKLNLNKELRRFLNRTLAINKGFMDVYLNHDYNVKDFFQARKNYAEYQVAKRFGYTRENTKDNIEAQTLILEGSGKILDAEDSHVLRYDSENQPFENIPMRQAMREYFRQNPELVTKALRDLVNEYIQAYYITSLYPQAQSLDVRKYKEQGRVKELEDRSEDIFREIGALRERGADAETIREREKERDAVNADLREARNVLSNVIRDWYKTYHSAEPTHAAAIDPRFLEEWQQTYRAMYRNIEDPFTAGQLQAIFDGRKIGNVLNARAIDLISEPASGIKHQLGLTGEEEVAEETSDYVDNYGAVRSAALIDTFEKLSERVQVQKLEEELEWLYAEGDKDPEIKAILDEITSVIDEIKHDRTMLGIPLEDMSYDLIQEIGATLRAIDLSPALRPLLAQFENYFVTQAKLAAGQSDAQKLQNASKSDASLASLDEFADRKPNLLNQDDIKKISKKISELSDEALEDLKQEQESWKKLSPEEQDLKKDRDRNIQGSVAQKELERQEKIKDFFARLTKASEKQKERFEDIKERDPELYERLQWFAGFIRRHPSMAVAFRQKFLGVLSRTLQHTQDPINEYEYVRREELNAVLDHFKRMDEAKDILPAVRRRDFILFPEIVAENLLPFSKDYNRRLVRLRRAADPTDPSDTGVRVDEVWEPLSHHDLIRDAGNAMNKAIGHAEGVRRQDARKTDNYIKEHVKDKSMRRDYKVHAHKMMLSDYYGRLVKELKTMIEVGLKDEKSVDHLEESLKTIEKAKKSLDRNIKKQGGSFKKSILDGIIERERKFLKKQLTFNRNREQQLEFDNYYYRKRKHQVVNVDKTLKKLHRFVVDNDYMPDLGINVIQEIRNEMILENTDIDLRVTSIQRIVGTLDESQLNSPIVKMKSLKGKHFYFALREHVRVVMLKQRKEFDYIDADQFFPVHGSSEGQKMAADEYIIRRHNRLNLQGEEFFAPDDPWVRDLVRYFGHEGGSDAGAGSKIMSGKMDVDQYKLAQLDTVRGLTDPSEGKNYLFLAPHIIGVDTGPHVISNWADSMTRGKQKTLFSLYADWLIRDFEAKQLKRIRRAPEDQRKLYRDRLAAWKSYFQLYSRQVTGRSSYIPKAVRDNPQFHIGKILLKFSDTNMLDKILSQAEDTFLKEYDVPETLSKEARQHLINTERGLRLVRKMATRRAWTDLEAKYQLMTILAHPKVWVGNVFGGGANILVQQGIQPIRRSFDYKWMGEHIDSSIKDRKSFYEWVQKMGVENSETSQEVDYFGFDKEGVRGNARRYTVIDTLEGSTDNVVAKSLTKFGASFIQTSERVLRAHAFASSYVHNMEIMGVNKANHKDFRPVLMHLAHRSVEATQFLYDNANRPFIAATPLGKAFFRFKLWVTRSLWKSWKMHQLSSLYGYRAGTPGHAQMKRFIIAMAFMQFMSELYPYTLFETGTHPLIDQSKQLSALLFGDDEEQHKAFFGWGEFGPLGALYGFASPTYMRLPNAVVQQTLHNVKTRGLDKISKSDSPFEAQIVKALEVHGFNVVQQIEVDGYLIDIGIVDKRTNQVILAIEADGHEYHSSRKERADDKRRQEHLEKYGYDFHRIKSKDWINDPYGEMEKLLARIQYESMRLELDPYYNHESEVRRISEIFYKSIMEGEYRKLATYHLWNSVPFGRLARNTIFPIQRSDSIGEGFIDVFESTTGLPVHGTGRELKKWLQEANAYIDHNGSYLYE